MLHARVLLSSGCHGPCKAQRDLQQMEGRHGIDSTHNGLQSARLSASPASMHPSPGQRASSDATGRNGQDTPRSGRTSLFRALHAYVARAARWTCGFSGHFLPRPDAASGMITHAKASESRSGVGAPWGDGRTRRMANVPHDPSRPMIIHQTVSQGTPLHSNSLLVPGTMQVPGTPRPRPRSPSFIIPFPLGSPPK